GGVRSPTINRLRVSWDMRNHVGVMNGVQRGEVASVEQGVALGHEREELFGATGALGSGSGAPFDFGNHNRSLPLSTSGELVRVTREPRLERSWCAASVTSGRVIQGVFIPG